MRRKDELRLKMIELTQRATGGYSPIQPSIPTVIAIGMLELRALVVECLPTYTVHGRCVRGKDEMKASGLSPPAGVPSYGVRADCRVPAGLVRRCNVSAQEGLLQLHLKTWESTSPDEKLHIPERSVTRELVDRLNRPQLIVQLNPLSKINLDSCARGLTIKPHVKRS
ncbi:hypothetical protein K438DRAFT_1945493 [Mycena galopus ATCC 62051]|nr:hypothetical protein K438DRAFT_1945493 [Mycena galopus ATCC 62051]